MYVLSPLASPVRVSPQENLKEIRKYLKIILCVCEYEYVCVHMCGHVCECAGVCMWRLQIDKLVSLFLPFLFVRGLTEFRVHHVCLG